MKRLSLFAVTALAAIACNKSELEVDSNTSLEGTPITITVEMPSSEDTKIEFDQTGDTWITKWSEGDALTAYNFNTTDINITTTAFTLTDVSDDGKSATFDGEYNQLALVLFYAGASAENQLGVSDKKVGLSLENQSISLSGENAAGALGEYSYLVSEPFLPGYTDDYTFDYNSVSIKHLTALMELKLQLENLPEDKTFSVSEVQIGVSQEDYEELVSEMTEAGMSADIPTFASIYNEEYYDITDKNFGEEGFATPSEGLSAYNLTIEGCEITSTDNSFTIPFNAFPFTVKQGEYFDITVVLTQSDEDGDMISSVPLNFSICNDNTGTDLEFGRGKHHTISYSYECDDQDFEFIWDGSTFESVADAEAALGEAVEDVYEIGTAAQLAAMSYLVNNDNSNYGSASYTLVAPLDLNGKEWTPIGNSDTNPFSGTFDGNNLTISGLYINSTSPCQGLFGVVSNETGKATIENVSVSGSITAGENSGGIVGMALFNTTINNCHNRASVTGSENAFQIGGIIGFSYSDNEKKNYIINCSNSGIIEASDYVGGIAGCGGAGSIVNSYNTGDVKGKERNIGGIAGSIGSANVTNCYNSGAVTGTLVVGGVIGLLDGGSVVDCYWLSGAGAASNGIGSDHSTTKASDEGTVAKTDAEMQSDDFATILTNGAYFYNSTDPAPAVEAYSWAMSSTPYPVLSAEMEATFNFLGDGIEELPYLITSASDLHQLSALVNAGEDYSGIYFEMTGDIDLGGISADGQTIITANEFSAIGRLDGDNNNYPFKGTFDGGGYEVSGLYINQPSSNNQGLFGYIEGATIKNLGVSGSVTGSNNVGGIVGCSTKGTTQYSYITNCYNKATIIAEGRGAGGIIGYSTQYSHIANCYNTGSILVSSGSGAGGIAGYLYYSSSIDNCYSTGSVTSSGNYGAVVGYIANNSADNVTNCYWLTGAASSGIGDISPTSGSGTDATIKMENSAMQDAVFATLLTNNAYTCNKTTPAVNACAWVAVSSSYPTFNYGVTPTYTQLSGEGSGTGL